MIEHVEQFLVFLTFLYTIKMFPQKQIILRSPFTVTNGNYILKDDEMKAICKL